MTRQRIPILALVTISAIGLSVGTTESAAQSASQRQAIEQSKAMVPMPPWPAGDERGMANTLGAGTWLRCAQHLTDPKAKSYEVSHLRSNSMPQSPFGVPLNYVYRPTASIPGTKHAFNDEHLEKGQPGAQGTQLDALGHFAELDKAWDGKGAIPVDGATYYGGYKQSEVKPTKDSPLLKLGVDKVPPIVTSAVLLDAKAHLGGGKAMEPGQLVTAKDIEDMIKAQGLGWRGLLPGDVLFVYTGWGDNWKDPDTEKFYYTMGPGLSFDAAKYLKEKAVVLVSLDNPFTDPVAKGFFQGKAAPPAGAPDGLPFVIHHYNLSKSGILQIQNGNFGALANDKVWTSCAVILPLRATGHAGSPVRPVAIGAPDQ